MRLKSAKKKKSIKCEVKIIPGWQQFLVASGFSC